MPDSDLPMLPQLRTRLVEGLAGALAADTRLDPVRARHAAEQVIDGKGLPADAADSEQHVCTLLCFNADSIQSWVFDSERVQVSSGASLKLDQLNQRIEDEMIEVDGVHGLVYSAGGAGMLFADAQMDPGKLKEAARKWLEERGYGLRFTVIAEPLRPRDLAPSSDRGSVLDRFQVVDGLRGALVRTQVALRQAKDSKAHFASAALVRRPGEIRAERCRSCGRREPPEPPVDDNPRYWCRHCDNLRDRKYFESAHGGSLTFDQLAESVERRRRYLGYVAIDGNAMGRIVQRVGTFLELRAFSEATSAVYGTARKRAPDLLRPFLKGREPRESMLSLLSGGDEITLVLPAAAAPHVACQVLKEIEAGFDQQLQPGGLLRDAFEHHSELSSAGAAAGVILAHPHYPVRLLRRYAEDLQKQRAKRYCATGNRSGIAWALLTDSSPLTESLERWDDSEDLGLAAFEQLLRETRAAHEKRLPVSALQGLLTHYRREERSLRALGGGNQESLDLLGASYFRYQLARNEELARWWKCVAPDATGAGDAVVHWFHAGGGRRLGQLVELLSLEPFSGEGVV